ncbi:DUF551 domain-containing protein [Enterobacter kobei]|uniref:DUF551 domain-containing protein n=1 Tax=Enterobacter kobei TaxID=208224 RepID=UPI002A814C82|nr:DUF551 domain-containing protein [Enterobacter kobei]
MSNIDKQAVQAVADLKAGYALGHADVAILNELARIALASLEAEPVAYVDPSAFNNFSVYRAGDTDNKRMGREWMWANPDAGLIPVYTAPPAPSVDEDLLHIAASAIDDLLSNKDRSGAGVWADVPAKLRRAAMLQGAVQPQNQQQNIPENIPAMQFKPVADLYGLTSPTGGETSFTFDAVEARDFFHGGWSVQEYVELERYQQACVGNSPVMNDYPETLPCPVSLEPGLKFGKGVATKILLDALQRRANYSAEIEVINEICRDIKDGDFLAAAKINSSSELVNTAYKFPKPIKDHRLNSGPDADDYYAGYQAGWNDSIGEAVICNSPVVQSGWVACSERMPEDNAEQEVLACFKGGDISTLYYFEGRWDDAYGIVPIRQDVTHWMPLPAAPQQEVKPL